MIYFLIFLVNIFYGVKYEVSGLFEIKIKDKVVIEFYIFMV